MVTTGLLILYAVVMLSGFYGLALQQFIPGQMMDGVSREVIYDQIPYLRKQLLKSAMELRAELSTRLPGPGRHDKTHASVQTLASTSGATMAATALAAGDPKEDEGREVLREALEGDVLPYLRASRRSRVNLGRRQVADNWFHLLRMSVSERHRAKVDEMHRWCEERRQMDLQSRLQHWLHYWLFVHVPASLLLLIWTAWHAVTGLFYY
jgi:hypothetical protein